MRGPRGIFVITAATVGLGVLAVPVASAELVAEPRVLYEVSETSGRIAIDSSQFHNDGNMLGGVGRQPGAYVFHPVTDDGKFDRIRVPSNASFNPGRAPFSYGATIKVGVDALWLHHEMAVVRHGDTDTPGGDYKLELDKNRSGIVNAECAIHDGDGDGSAYAISRGTHATLADGEWHTVTCARVDVNTVSLTIDGHVKEVGAVGALGAIRSEDPFLLGVQPYANKPELRFREQFHGLMTDVHLTVYKKF